MEQKNTEQLFWYKLWQFSSLSDSLTGPQLKCFCVVTCDSPGHSRGCCCHRWWTAPPRVCTSRCYSGNSERGSTGPLPSAPGLWSSPHIWNRLPGNSVGKKSRRNSVTKQEKLSCSTWNSSQKCRNQLKYYIQFWQLGSFLRVSPHHIAVLTLRGAVPVIELHALQGAMTAHTTETIGVEEFIHGSNRRLRTWQSLATLPTNL